MMYNWENAISRKGSKDVAVEEKIKDSAIRLGVAQINLRVTDYEAMKGFYTQVLGKTAWETNSSEDRSARACVFEMPNVNLVLVEERSASNRQELVFGVGSNEAVEAVYNHMKSLPDCAVIQFPHYALDNRYETIFEDPEGNRLVFRD